VSKIIIGKAGSKNVGFDLDVLLSSRLLITADSGGGKSWLMRALQEQLFGKIQIITIDPEGEFASLREKFPFVLVGKGGETPADTRSAALVAERLLKLRASAICDIFEMKPAQRHSWVNLFLQALIEAPRELRNPCIVIVDEAHMFCPEKGMGESEASGAMVDLCTRGRKRGLCAVWATQRLAAVDKSATSMLQNRMVGPTFEDVNRKRAGEMLGVLPGAPMREFFKQMQLLEPGNFFAFGRAIAKERTLVHVRPIQTSHPKAFGAAHSAAPPPTPAKIKAMLPKLADLPKEAEEKARTEADFRREIRELKTKLTLAERATPKPAHVAKPDPAQARSIQLLRAALSDARGVMAKMANMELKAAVIDRQAVETAVREAVDRVLRLSTHASAQQQKQIDQLKREAKPMLDRLQRLLDAPVAVPAAPVTPQRSEPAPRPAIDATEEPVALEGVSPAQSRILNALAEFNAIGIESISRKWLAARAGASHSSSHYQNNLGALRARGLIEYQGGAIRLTPAGRDLTGERNTPPLTVEEMANSCKRLLTGSQQKIFDALHAAYPNSVSREDLAAKAGASATSSHFQNNLGALRSAAMVAYEPDRSVRMEKWVFLENGEAA
jgi:hypothetical protein